MELKDIEVIIGIIIAVITTLYGLYKKGIVPMFKLCRNKYDSVKSFICDVQESVKLVNTELKPNHGSSIKDAISRIDNKVHILEAKNRAYFSHMQVPIVEFNENGHLIWMNRAGHNLFQKDMSELVNFGWLSSLSKKDRDIVEDEIIDAVRQERSFSIQFTIDNHNKILDILCDASPILTNHGKFFGYFGILRILPENTP